MQRRFHLLLFVFFFAQLPSAFAQSSDPSIDRVAAEALFRAGREALRKGNVELACARFGDSHRVDPFATGPLLNLAECDEHRGALNEARDKLRRAIERLPAEDERRTHAETRARDLDARIPRIVGSLPPDAPPSTTVLIDGVAAVTPPDGVWSLDPGAHEIVVRASGRLEHKVTIQLVEGQTLPLSLRPGEPTPAPSSPAGPQPQIGSMPARGSPRRTVGYVVGGAGLVALGVGGVTGWMALDRASTFREHCDATGCDDTGLAAAQSGRQLDVLSAVTLSAGAVALVTGIYLVVSAPRSTKASHSHLGFVGTF